MLTRKCTCCKDSFEVVDPYDKSYVSYKAKWYHTDCLKELELKSKRMKIDWAFTFEGTEQFVEINSAKDKLAQYICRHYILTMEDLTTQGVWVKLASIYNGTHAGLEEGIDPRDLYNILTENAVQLDKYNPKNLSGVSKLKYDLAIVINKLYERYKMHCESVEEDTQDEEEYHIEYKQSNTSTANDNSLYNEDVIGDIDDW